MCMAKLKPPSFQWPSVVSRTLSGLHEGQARACYRKGGPPAHCPSCPAWRWTANARDVAVDDFGVAVAKGKRIAQLRIGKEEGSGAAGCGRPAAARLRAEAYLCETKHNLQLGQLKLAQLYRHLRAGSERVGGRKGNVEEGSREKGLQHEGTSWSVRLCPVLSCLVLTCAMLSTLPMALLRLAKSGSVAKARTSWQRAKGCLARRVSCRGVARGCAR